jgi:hypothetical protein
MKQKKSTYQASIGRKWLLPNVRVMKVTIALALFLLTTLNAYSQVDVTATGGTASASYTTIKAAFDAVNAGTHTGTITLSISANTTESASAVLNASGGSSSYSSLIISPSGGAARTITGSITGPLIDLSGADNVTIDGLNTGSNSLTINNTATTTASTVRFIGDASNNTIQNCTLQGASANAAYGIVFFNTGTTTGNDNNTITGCNINGGGTSYNCIYASGTASPADNSNITISNCSIYDFANLGGTSCGILVSSGNTDWTITANNIYQTATRTATAAMSVFGISVSNSSGNNFVVSNNNIGGGAVNCGGTAWTVAGSFANRFQAISLSVGTTTASSVQNNTIANYTWSSSSGATTLPGVWAGIYLSTGSANIGTTTGNTIGSGTGTNSVQATISTTGGVSMGIGAASTGTVAISKNTIGSVNVKGSTTSVSHSFNGIWTTGAAASMTISNNTIGSTSTAGSITYSTAGTGSTIALLQGIVNSGGATAIAITNNTVANLTNAYVPTTSNSGSNIRGIFSSSGVNTITGNLVRNLTAAANSTGTGSSGTVIGICVTSTTAGTLISQDTVYALSNTHATVNGRIIGIAYSGATTGTNIVERNLVYDIDVSSTSCQIIGIDMVGGTTQYQNNIIRLGTYGNSATTGYTVIGFNENAGTPVNNLYYNTVYIGGSVTTGVGNSFCINSTVTATRSIKNNIFYNVRTTSLTAKQYSVRLANTTGLTIDNNNYYVSGSTSYIALFAGADKQLLSDLKASTTQDANSVSLNPNFVSTTNLTPTSCYTNDKGVSAGSVSNDFSGVSRNATTPDIGAIEYTPATPAAPTVSSPVTYCQNATATALSASGSNTLVWYTISSGGVGSSTVPVPATTAAGTVSYYVTDSNATSGCTSSRAQIDVAVSTVIAGNTIISSTQTVCSGSAPAQITASTPSGGDGSSYTYQWLSSTTDATGGFVVIPSTNTQNHTPSVLSQTTWFRRVVTSGVCGADTTAAVQVAVTNPVSGNSISGSAQTVCSGSNPAQITAAIPAGGDGSLYTYQWLGSTTSATEGFSLISSSNVQQYTPLALTATTWFRRVVSSGACANDTTSAVQIVVNQVVATNTITGSTQTICTGSSPAQITASVATGGNGSTYTYQWLSSTTSASAGFSAISSSNTQNYTPAALTATTWYRRVVSSGVCSTDSTTAIQVTVNPNLTASVSMSATATSVCGPGSITFTATPANGGTSPAYQWKLNGANAGTNSNTFVLSSPAVNDSVYVVLTSNATCVENATANSNGVKLTNSTVTPSVNITVADSFICSGSTTVFTATPTNGGSNPAFQWKKNGVDVGTNSNTYSNNSLLAGDSITLVLTSNASCLSNPTATSNFIRISIRQVTAISVNPLSITRCAGTSAGFSVTATGNGTVTYQWQKNGNPISGAQASTYTIATTSLTDSGSYSVVVTAGCGSLTSSVGYLTMNAPVANNTATGTQTICNGSVPASLIGEVPSGGNGSTYTYSWLSSTTGATAGFSAIASSNTQNFTPAALTATTWFRRVVTSGICANDTTAAVQVVVTQPVSTNSITGSAQTICSGTAPAQITASVASGGNGSTYTYGWLISTTSATAGFSAITSSNIQNFTPAALTATTWFRRVVTSGVCSNDTTATVQIIVTQPVATNSITGSAQTICSGTAPAQITASVASGGNGSTYTYGWLISTTSATAGFSAITSSNTQNFTPAALTATTWFRRVVTSGVCSNDTTAAVQIIVTQPVATNSITGSAQTICSGTAPAQITASVATGGNGSTYTYGWLSSTTSATTGFSAITSSNTQNFTPAALTATTWFRRVVTSGICSNDTTAAVQIIVTQPVATNSITGSAQIICSGSAPAQITASVASGGNGSTYTYGWLISTTSATSGFSAITSSNIQNFTPAALTATTWFRRVVTSGVCANDTTVAIKITVTVPVTTNSATAAQTICSGSTPAVLTGSIATGGDGSSYTYSWLSSTTSASAGFALATGTNNTQNYTPAALTQNTWYRRVVTSGVCAKDTSVAIAISVNVAITTNTAAGVQTICSGSVPTAITGSTPAGGNGSTYTYGWLSSTTSANTGFAAASGTNSNQDYTPAALSQTTWYKRVVTSGVCAKDTSAAVQVTVTIPVATNTAGGVQTICTGSVPAALTGSTATGGDGSTYTYGWLSSITNATAGFAAASGTNTNQGYTPSALTQTTWYRRVVTSGACAKDTSAAVQVTVNTPGTWSGAISNVWSSTANWSCPQVPTSATNVTIPTGAVNMPVIVDAQQVANLTIQTGAALTLNVAASSLSIFGTIANNGTFTNSNGKIVMTGTTSQTLPAGIYAKLEIKNPAGVILTGTTTLTDSLILTSGNLSLGSNNLVLGNTSYASDGSSLGYVMTGGTGVMTIQNIGTTGKTGNIMFPVGNSSYNPVKLNNAGTTDHFSVRVIDSVTTSYLGTSATGSKITSGAVNRSWFITEAVPGGSNLSISPVWSAANELTGFSRSASYVAQYNGSTWLSATASSAVGSNPYSSTRSGITSGSVFGVGSGGTLPVTLIHFSGHKQYQAVQLDWVTASEINNDHFVLQRSVNGKNFETVATIKGNGTTANRSTYDYLDKAAGSIAKGSQVSKLYYRLVQVDADHTQTESEVITIAMDAETGAMNVQVSPNPFMDITTVSVNATKTEQAVLKVTDLQGRLVFEKDIQLEAGENPIVLDQLATTTSSGVYFVNIITGSESVVKRMVRAK